MRVPKMVKNGFYYHFSIQRLIWSFFSLLFNLSVYLSSKPVACLTCLIILTIQKSPISHQKPKGKTLWFFDLLRKRRLLTIFNQFRNSHARFPNLYFEQVFYLFFWLCGAYWDWLGMEMDIWRALLRPSDKSSNCVCEAVPRGSRLLPHFGLSRVLVLLLWVSPSTLRSD